MTNRERALAVAKKFYSTNTLIGHQLEEDIEQTLAAAERETLERAADMCNAKAAYYDKKHDCAASRGAYGCAQDVRATAKSIQDCSAELPASGPAASEVESVGGDECSVSRKPGGIRAQGSSLSSKDNDAWSDSYGSDRPASKTTQTVEQAAKAYTVHIGGPELCARLKLAFEDGAEWQRTQITPMDSGLIEKLQATIDRQGEVISQQMAELSGKAPTATPLLVKASSGIDHSYPGTPIPEGMREVRSVEGELVGYTTKAEATMACDVCEMTDGHDIKCMRRQVAPAGVELDPAKVHDAFLKAWLEVAPSMETEGRHVDRGDFKAGWYSACRWVKEQQARPGGKE